MTIPDSLGITINSLFQATYHTYQAPWLTRQIYTQLYTFFDKSKVFFHLKNAGISSVPPICGMTGLQQTRNLT